jgi:hypothetical protein
LFVENNIFIDVFCVAVLWKYGGWWLDWGTIVLKSLDDFKNAVGFGPKNELHSTLRKITSFSSFIYPSSLSLFVFLGDKY